MREGENLSLFGSEDQVVVVEEFKLRKTEIECGNTCEEKSVSLNQLSY